MRPRRWAGLGLQGAEQLNNKGSSDDGGVLRPDRAPEQRAAEDRRDRGQAEKSEGEGDVEASQRAQARAARVQTAEEVLAEQERADLEARGSERTEDPRRHAGTHEDDGHRHARSQAHVVTDLPTSAGTSAQMGEAAADDGGNCLPEPAQPASHRRPAEAEIQTVDAKIRHEKDTNVLLRREADRQGGRGRSRAGGGLSTESFVWQCRFPPNHFCATLEDLATMYSDMKACHPDEYVDTACKGWRCRAPLCEDLFREPSVAEEPARDFDA